MAGLGPRRTGYISNHKRYLLDMGAVLAQAIPVEENQLPRRKPNARDLQERELLSKEMKGFREANLLKQTTLAEVLGLSRRTIQMIESGSISPHPGTVSAFRLLVAKYKSAKSVKI